MRFKLGQKIIFFLAVILSMISVIEIVTYKSLKRLDMRLKFVEMADDLTRNILEMRRFEKNYFLYHDQASLAEALEYIHPIRDLSSNLRKESSGVVGNKTFIEFDKNLETYRLAIEDLIGSRSTNEQRGVLLRITGRRLYQLTTDMVKHERLEISTLIDQYKKVSYGGIVFIIFFAVISYYLVRSHMATPLGLMEKATRKIAHGDFTVIPEIRSHDEIGSCIAAFNRMVKELQENQDILVQTKKLASLGTLTSGVAHELNNPLNNILTSCQIIIEELDSEDREYLQKLLKNIVLQTEKARDIVKNLLEFSHERISALEQIGIKELVADTFELLKSDLPDNIETVIHIEENIPYLKADRVRLQQALLNIISNAVQAMPEGGKLAFGAAAENGAVVISISDTGIGIPADDLGKIFDPFFTTKEVGKGTGLGLSVSYGIIEKHGGHLAVKSEIGKGTTFTITLPQEIKNTGQSIEQ